MNYPDYMVGWLYDILEAFGWQYTPLQILETEDRYPDLFYAFSLEGWQRRLIKEQLEGDSHGDQ